MGNLLDDACFAVPPTDYSTCSQGYPQKMWTRRGNYLLL